MNIIDSVLEGMTEIQHSFMSTEMSTLWVHVLDKAQMAYINLKHFIVEEKKCFTLMQAIAVAKYILHCRPYQVVKLYQILRF